MHSHLANFSAAVFWAFACVSTASASSTAGSSAADSASSATSSASDSLKTSSNGSSKATGIAQGEYKIIAIERLADGKVQLSLQAVQEHPTEALTLTMTERIFTSAQLAIGNKIAAKLRTYGVEFSRSADGAPFLLVLEDAVFKELNSVAVSL